MWQPAFFWKMEPKFLVGEMSHSGLYDLQKKRKRKKEHVYLAVDLQETCGCNSHPQESITTIWLHFEKGASTSGGV